MSSIPIRRGAIHQSTRALRLYQPSEESIDALYRRHPHLAVPGPQPANQAFANFTMEAMIRANLPAPLAELAMSVRRELLRDPDRWAGVLSALLLEVRVSAS